MRTKVRRHLGKVVAGAAIAVAATAAMVAITLPGDAVAGNGKTGADGRAAAAGETGEQGIGTGSAGAVRPGVVEEPAAEGEKGIGSDPLTDDEMERAERIATSGQASARARNVEGERGPQLISASTSEVQEGA
ncbi:Tat pathway signal sequence domain protein, partial [Streptomyces sp. GC420]|nr:Tat pathway signal sequence domain protein [Streptomyces sp. GC420]